MLNIVECLLYSDLSLYNMRTTRRLAIRYSLSFIEPIGVRKVIYWKEDSQLFFENVIYDDWLKRSVMTNPIFFRISEMWYPKHWLEKSEMNSYNIQISRKV